MKRYRRGAMTKTTPETIRSRLLPILSDRTPTGNEHKIPANGDTAAIIPRVALPDPNACAKSGNTGLFERVVENIAKKPSRNSENSIFRSFERWSMFLPVNTVN
jgi:hypothetical protein